MKYNAQLENKINATNMDRETRNKELAEYSRKHVKDFEQQPNKNYDTVTNLPGLRLFFYEADSIVEANPELRYGVITMDIAQFKAVNEFCGRKAGDELLSMISTLFHELETSRPYTKAGHARADSFLMFTSYEKESELVAIAEFLYDAIVHYPFPYKVAPSFGICCDPEPMPAASFLKDCAMIALNEIKGKFYAHYAVFDENMRRNLLKEKQVENDIINALEQEELQVYVQPKVDMRTGEIVGGEALVRWKHPELGMIPPGDFLPVLEKNGFIIQLDYYVWERVFRFQQERMIQGRKLLPISINLSRVHAHDDDLGKTLMDMSKRYAVAPEYVILEVTESAFEAHAEKMLENLIALRQFGFAISIDDFGTGYSSLKMISSYTADEVKIDRSFILGLENPKNRVVLENILRMMRGLDVKFIVEGVETKDQINLLLQLGCPMAQGFYYYKPMPIQEYNELIKS